MKESAIVRKMIAAVQRAYPDAEVWKASDRFTRGVADLHIVWAANGRLLYLRVEAKTDAGKATELQKYCGAKFNELGAKASGAARWIVARTVEEVLTVMKEMSA